MSVLAVAMYGPVAAPVAAAQLVASGWWTSSPVPVAPDASEDALVVQGGPGGPFSFAAVEFSLSDETPSALSLTVASGSASSPGAELIVCPLVGDLEPAHGAPAGEAPEYDCDSPVVGTLSGSTYRFFVSGLAEEDRLAVAILPSAPTDRVVLDAPGPAALGTLPGSSATDGDTGSLPAGGSGGDASGASDGGDSSPSFGGAPSPLPSTPSFSPPEPVGPPAPDSTGTPGVGEGAADDSPGASEGAAPRGAVPIGAVDEGADPLAVILFLVLGGVAAGLWLAAGRSGTDVAAPEPAG